MNTEEIYRQIIFFVFFFHSKIQLIMHGYPSFSFAEIFIFDNPVYSVGDILQKRWIQNNKHLKYVMQLF